MVGCDRRHALGLAHRWARRGSPFGRSGTRAAFSRSCPGRSRCTGSLGRQPSSADRARARARARPRCRSSRNRWHRRQERSSRPMTSLKRRKRPARRWPSAAGRRGRRRRARRGAAPCPGNRREPRAGTYSRRSGSPASSAGAQPPVRRRTPAGTPQWTDRAGHRNQPGQVRVVRSDRSAGRSRSSMTVLPDSSMARASSGSQGLFAGGPASGVDSPSASAAV